MTRLYAATGDGIARLEESAGSWTVELRLAGSGAQCLAVDPNDPDIVYAGLRERGVRRTVDAGASWIDCTVPEPGVFSLAVSAAAELLPDPADSWQAQRGQHHRQLGGIDVDHAAAPRWVSSWS